MEFLFGLLLIPVWSAAFTRSKAAQEATLLWTLAVAIDNVAAGGSAHPRGTHERIDQCGRTGGAGKELSATGKHFEMKAIHVCAPG